MIIEAKDIEVSAYPPAIETGMQTGRIPKGVMIKHLQTGIVVVCDKHRHQHMNRSEALAELQSLLQAKEANSEGRVNGCG